MNTTTAARRRLCRNEPLCDDDNDDGPTAAVDAGKSRLCHGRDDDDDVVVAGLSLRRRVRSCGFVFRAALGLLCAASVMVSPASGAASTAPSSSSSSRRSDTCGITGDYFLDHSASLVDGAHILLRQEILASQVNGLNRHPVCKPGPTCCSDSGEEKLPVLANRLLKEVLTNVSKPLIDELKRAQNALQSAVSETVASSEKSTTALLNQYYSDHGDVTEAAAKQLFSELRRELSPATFSPPQASATALEAAVETFFDDVFPIVYVKIDPSRDLTPSYRECLRRERRDLRPFGATPAIQAQVFVQAANTIRTLSDGVKAALDAVVGAAEEAKGRTCEVAVARLTTCPICSGFEPWSGQNRACGDFCMNVLRGCMAPWSELETAWLRLIDALGSFVAVASNSERGFPSSSSSSSAFGKAGGADGAGIDGESGARLEEDIRAARIDPQAALRDFDLKVAKAVHTAMQQGLTMQEKIKGKCGGKTGSPSPSSSSSSSSLAGERRRRRSAAAAVPGARVRVRRMTGESRLVEDLEKLSTTLSRRRAFFSTLADEVCVELGARSKENCWNGQDIGKYSSAVVEISPSAQKTNPEMAGLDMTLATAVVANLSSRLTQIANDVSREKYLTSGSSSAAASGSSRSLRAGGSSPSSSVASAAGFTAVGPSSDTDDGDDDGDNIDLDRRRFANNNNRNNNNKPVHGGGGRRFNDQDTDAFVGDAHGAGSGSGGRLDGGDDDFAFPPALGPGVDDEDRYAWNGGAVGQGRGRSRRRRAGRRPPPAAVESLAEHGPAGLQVRDPSGRRRARRQQHPPSRRQRRRRQIAVLLLVARC